MEELDYQEIIKAKLCEILQYKGTIDETVNLVDIGFNSMNAIRFVVELETLFGITIDDEELLLDNFSSLERVYELVKQKTAVSS